MTLHIVQAGNKIVYQNVYVNPIITMCKFEWENRWDYKRDLKVSMLYFIKYFLMRIGRK